MPTDPNRPLALGRRIGVVVLATVTAIFWLLGLYTGAWAVHQLGPATLGNRTLVFGQAASPWFTAGGLLTIAVLVTVAAFRVDTRDT